MKRIVSFLLFLFLLIASCKDKETIGTNNSVIPVIALSHDSNIYWIDRALDSGNIRTYNRVSYNHFIRDNPEPFLFPAMIMANKYDNPDAYYHVYQILNSMRNQEKLDSLDYRTRNLALHYLVKAYEKGQMQAQTETLKIFGNKASIPSSSSFLLKLAELK